jgi:arginyl-tRNA---protein transferase
VLKLARKSSHISTKFNLEETIHASEAGFLTGHSAAHKFEVGTLFTTLLKLIAIKITLEPSSFTEEKFQLFQSYEENIHKKPDKDPDSFTRFLVESPLIVRHLHYARQSDLIHLEGTYPVPFASAQSLAHRIWRISSTLPS